MKFPEGVRFAVRLGFEFEAGMLELLPSKNVTGTMLRIVERTDLRSPKYSHEVIHLDFGFGDRQYVSAADQLVGMHPGRFNVLPSGQRHAGLLVLCGGYELCGSDRDALDQRAEEILAGGQELPPDLGRHFRSVTTVMADGWVAVLMRYEGEPATTVVCKPGTLPDDMEDNHLLGPLGWLNEKVLAHDS